MKILLVGYYAINEVTPRAFRAKYLFDYYVEKDFDVEYVSVRESARNIGDASVRAKKYSFIPQFLKSWIKKVSSFLLPGGIHFLLSTRLIRKLNGKDADLVISIALPFFVHFSVSYAKKYGLLRVGKCVADYGDPFSKNAAGELCFYARSIERWVLKQFDHVVVPVAPAIKSFDGLLGVDKPVHVIPQGFPLNVRPRSTVRYGEIKFCYAGILYRDIRDPTSFLNYLSTLSDVDFVFYFLTDVKNVETMQILAPFVDVLKNKVKIMDFMPRESCIDFMSEMDFLVNFLNSTQLQQPSKIVDYVLSGSPFLSISSSCDDYSEFDRFLSRDFVNFKSKDISDFDIKNVGERFLRLYKG